VDKTKAINFLAKNSSYDIISIWDTDLIKQSTYLENCLKLLTKDNFVQNYARYVNTAFTKKIFDEKLTYEQIAYWDERFPTCFNRADAPSQICLYKKDFLSIGGLYEKFFGWGPEDSDFVRRLKRYGKACVVAEPCCYHLEHSTKDNYHVNPMTVKSNNFRIAQENDENNVIIVDNSGKDVHRPENQWDQKAKPERIDI
jgi:GT2 family glycosyltransferase